MLRENPRYTRIYSHYIILQIMYYKKIKIHINIDADLTNYTNIQEA